MSKKKKPRRKGSNSKELREEVNETLDMVIMMKQLGVNPNFSKRMIFSVLISTMDNEIREKRMRKGRIKNLPMSQRSDLGFFDSGG